MTAKMHYGILQTIFMRHFNAGRMKMYANP